MELYLSVQKKCFFVLLFLSLFFFACEPENSTQKIDLSKRKQVQSKKELDALTYAYLPQYSHRVSFSRHHLLVEYLSKKTDIPIRQVYPDTFKDHVQMVGEGKIDISFSNPFVYIRIADRFNARAFARIQEKNGATSFRGQIICRKDNKAIQNIQDCRNTHWMAVSPISAAGYLFALNFFYKHGIEKSDFRKISFAPGSGGKQEKVVKSVYLGEADIGSIREGTLQLLEDSIDLDAIRILDQTKRFPSWVYAARQGLDEEVVEKIKKALLELNPKKKKHAKILDRAHFQGIVTASDRDFDPIRKIDRQIEVNLSE